ncbi:MAG: hypothetical protein KDC27_03845 [Acidobacteria bacterium]|nr:hypothetical protein [Acidobacteriota bacterium]
MNDKARILHWLSGCSKSLADLRKKFETSEFQSAIERQLPLDEKKRDQTISQTWHRSCAAMDVLEDGHSGIEYYSTTIPDSRGPLYVLIYGILQITYVQQDALKCLRDAVGLPTHLSLPPIRETRNDFIGHPTNRKGSRGALFISRPSLSKSQFQGVELFDDGPIFHDVALLNQLSEHLEWVCMQVSEIAERVGQTRMSPLSQV